MKRGKYISSPESKCVGSTGHFHENTSTFSGFTNGKIQIGEVHQVWISAKWSSTFIFNSVYAKLKQLEQKTKLCRCAVGLRVMKRKHRHYQDIIFDIKKPYEIVLFFKRDPIRKGKYLYSVQLFKSDRANTTTMHLRFHGHEEATEILNQTSFQSIFLEVVENYLNKISTKEINPFDHLKSFTVSKLELAVRYHEKYERKIAKLLSKIAYTDIYENRATTLREFGDKGIYIYRVPLKNICGFKADIKTYRRRQYNTPAQSFYDHPKLEVSIYSFPLDIFQQGEYEKIRDEASLLLSSILRLAKVEKDKIYGLADPYKYQGAADLVPRSIALEVFKELKQARNFVAFSEQSYEPESSEKIKAIIKYLKERERDVRYNQMQILIKELREGKVFPAFSIAQCFDARSENTFFRKLRNFLFSVNETYHDHIETRWIAGYFLIGKKEKLEQLEQLRDYPRLLRQQIDVFRPPGLGPPV